MAIRKYWLPLVVGVEIILVTLYAGTALANEGEPAWLFDVNGFGSLPSWVQAIQLFFIGALPFWLYLTYRPSKTPPSRWLLLCVALLFLCASVDELFKLSFLFDQHRLLQVSYLLVGLAIPVIFYRDIRRLYRLSPESMWLVALGMVVFGAGGFGLEVFRSRVQEPHWYDLFGRWQFYQVDAIRTALEELGEMLGETLVIKGMLQLARQRQAQQVYSSAEYSSADYR